MAIPSRLHARLIMSGMSDLTAPQRYASLALTLCVGRGHGLRTEAATRQGARAVPDVTSSVRAIYPRLAQGSQ